MEQSQSTYSKAFKGFLTDKINVICVLGKVWIHSVSFKDVPKRNNRKTMVTECPYVKTMGFSWKLVYSVNKQIIALYFI